MFLYKHEIVTNILNKKHDITQKDLNNIRDASDLELSEINKSIGSKIRNLYSLWNVKNTNCFEYKTEKMLIHPNDFTLEVLKEVREKLNEEEEF
jgi:hypothetical protein